MFISDSGGVIIRVILIVPLLLATFIAGVAWHALWKTASEESKDELGWLTLEELPIVPDKPCVAFVELTSENTNGGVVRCELRCQRLVSLLNDKGEEPEELVEQTAYVDHWDEPVAAQWVEGRVRAAVGFTIPEDALETTGDSRPTVWWVLEVSILGEDGEARLVRQFILPVYRVTDQRLIERNPTLPVIH